MQEDELKLTASLKTCKVSIDDTKYVLRELVGSQRDAHLDTLLKNSDKNGKVRSFDNIQAKLVQKCMRLVNEPDKSLPLEWIQELPASTLQALFLKCQELSGLDVTDEEALEKAKKD